MDRLIADLLDVARVQAGKLTVTRARASAVELVVEAVDMQRALATAAPNVSMRPAGTVEATLTP